MQSYYLPYAAYDEFQTMFEENGIEYETCEPVHGERMQIIVKNTEGTPYKTYTFDDELYETLD